MSRVYLESRDPKGLVLTGTACSIGQNKNTANYSRVPLSNAFVLSVNANIKAKHDQILKLLRIWTLTL
jgi:hypothetical protein